MKTNKKIILLILIFIVIIISGGLIYNHFIDMQLIDYSKYSYFTNIKWERKTDSDTEYLIFNNDGTVSYYCACGSPVNSNDLCNTYRYNEKTKTIKIKCIIRPPKTVTKIKINKYDENSIELDFEGEIKTFIK